MKDCVQIKNSINARDTGLHARQGGARLSRRFMKRLLSLLLALYLLLNSFAFAMDDADMYPTLASSEQSGSVEEAPVEMDMSLEGDPQPDQEADPNTFVYILHGETELSIGALIKQLKMPFDLEDIQYVTVLGSEEDLVLGQSEPLTVVMVEQDYIISIEHAFAEAGVTIYTNDGGMYTLKLRTQLADEDANLAMNELGEVMLGEIFTGLESDSGYVYSMENDEGPVYLSQILSAVHLPLQTRSVTSVGVVEQVAGDAQRLSVAQENGDYVIMPLENFDALELAVCADSGIYTIALLNGRAVENTEAPTEAPTDAPTDAPEETPTPEPTEAPVEEVEAEPTGEPEETPTPEPTEAPIEEVEAEPTGEPEETPTPEPTEAPVEEVEVELTGEPEETPTPEPTEAPVEEVEVELTGEPEETQTSEPTEAPAEEVQVNLGRPRFESSAEELDMLASVFVDLTSQGTVETTPLTVAAVAQTKTYGETDPIPTATAEGLPEGYTITVTAWHREETGEAVGAYAIALDSVQIMNDANEDVTDNYEITFEPANLTITTATATVTAVAKTKVYGDADPELTATVTGLVGTDAITYTLSRAEGEDVGDYAITPAGEAEQGNYTVTFVPASLTITKATATVTAQNAEKTYGDADPTLTATVTGLKNGDAESVITYTFSRAEGEDVGDYDISVSGETDQGNYTVIFVPASLTITKATATVTAQNAEKVYGDADPTLTATVTGLKNGDDESVIAYTVSRDEDEDVGTYAITVTGEAEQGNYQVTYAGPATFTITQRPVVMRAKKLEKVYGDSDPDLEVEIVYDSEAPEDAGKDGLISDDELGVVYTLSRVSGEDVANSPYSIQIEIDETQTQVNPNYQVHNDLNYGTLTITPAPVTVTAEDAEKDYGEDDPESWEVEIEGLKNNEPESLISYTVSRAEGEDAGKYAITPSGDAEQGNYTVTFVDGTFTINRLLLMITADELEKVYGEADPELTAEVDGLPVPEGEGELPYTTACSKDEDTGVFAYTIHMKADGEDTARDIHYAVSRASGEDAGMYPITVTAAAQQGNYEVICEKSLFTINPKSVTVTADSFTVAYGDPDPELTAQLTGLDEGDTVNYETREGTGANAGTWNVVATIVHAGRTDTLSYSIRRDAGAVVGEYDIYVEGKETQGNYEIEFLTGTLTILPKIVVQKTLLNESANQSRTFTFTATLTTESGEPYSDAHFTENVYTFEIVVSKDKPVAQIGFPVPLGASVTVAETPNDYYTTQLKLDDGEAQAANSATVTVEQDSHTFAFENTRIAICQIVVEGEPITFVTIKDAVDYAVKNPDKTATIEMLRNYVLAAEDVVIIPSGSTITLTSAGGNSYTVSRSQATAGIRLLENRGALTLENITLNGDNVTSSMPLLQNSGTLTVGSGATITGANGASALYVTGGPVNINSGSVVTDNTAANGGALYVTNGTVNINAKVYGNTATNGGVLFQTGGTVNVCAEVTNNNMATNGGVAYIQGGTFNVLADGNVHENKAKNGGAIYATGGAIYVKDGGKVQHNEATDGNGGAIYALNATIVANGCTISDNTASNNGGAIHMEGGSLTIDAAGTTSTLNNNTAGGNGGAINATSGKITINNGTINIKYNTAAESGGAINVGSASVSIGRGAFHNNKATNGNGGAVCADSGAVTISDGEFRRNTATNGNGGAIYDETGTVSFTGGTIGASDEGNSAKNGAAIFVGSGIANISASITYNTASDGGAIGVGSTSARLYFDKSAEVNNNTMNGAQSNVYLDQDSELIINAVKLNSGKKIGVYVPGNYDSELVVKHGDVTGYFGAYTEKDNVMTTVFKNDRYDVEVKSENNRLYWAKALSYDVYYLKDYSTAQFPPTTVVTTVVTGQSYYPRSRTSNIYDLVMAMKLIETHKNLFKTAAGDNYASTAVYAYTFSDQAMTGFADYLQTVEWDGQNRRWKLIKQNGEPDTEATNVTSKLKIFYSAPAYLTIVNNNESDLTLNISELTVLGKNAADASYGFVTARNGATASTLLPIAAADLVIPKGESRKLMFPGAQGQGFVLRGRFENASEGAQLSYTFNGTPGTTPAQVDFTSFSFYSSDTAAELIFGKALPICQVGAEQFSTLKAAKDYIVAQKTATGITDYTIEMLVDYLVPAGDVLDIPAGLNITFTTVSGFSVTEGNNTRTRAILSRDTGNSGSSVKAEWASPSDDNTLTVTNLIFDGRSLTAGGAGGAVKAVNCGTVTIDNCDFKGFRADWGGAVYVDNKSMNSSLTVRGCDFSNCQTSASVDKAGGGGVWTTARYLTVDDCTFVDCACTGGSAQAGAVFHNIQGPNQKNNNTDWFPNSTTVVKNCTFNNCYSAQASGGTIESDAWDVTILNCDFEGSYSSKPSGSNGGAINVYARDEQNTSQDCVLRLLGCTFNNCHAKLGDKANGGAVRTTSKRLVMWGCKFNNTQSVTGGAVSMTNTNGGTKLEIYACEFDNCVATGNGGAVNTVALDIKVGDEPGDDLVLPEGITRDEVKTHGIKHTAFTDCSAKLGGGIYNAKDDADVKLENVSFTRCVAKTGSGGALYTQAQTLSIKGEPGNTFTDCTAQNSGGAVFQNRNADGSSVTLENCAFVGCQSNAGNGNGGGMYCKAKTVTITGIGEIENDEGGDGDGNGGDGNGGDGNEGDDDGEGDEEPIVKSVFRNCTANNAGGGLYHDYGSGSVTITNCGFDGCEAKSSNGGGLYTNAHTLAISGENSDFTGCKAQADGGGLYHVRNADGSEFSFSDGSFVGCTAVGNLGGAIYTSAKGVTLKDAAVKNSTAKAQGGGVWINPAKAEFTNCKITGDTVTNSDSKGGGVYVGGGTTTYYNGTVSGCSAADGGGWYQAAGTLRILGGVISGQATNGGGLYQVGGTVNHYGGLVSGTASVDGGGVYKRDGTYNLGKGTVDNVDYSGGTVGGAVIEEPIDDDEPTTGDDDDEPTGDDDEPTTVEVTYKSSASNGGAFYQNAGTLNIMDGGMLGGAIEDAAIATNGGGVYQAAGTVNLKAGGCITGCKSTSNGGGAYVAGGTFNLGSYTDNTTYTLGGDIEDNKAANGGGVYVAGGTFNMRSGSIADNTASGNGGGLYHASGVASLGAGEIKDNTAAKGGGAFVANEQTLSLNGWIEVSDITPLTITGNHATAEGGGIAVGGSSAVLNFKNRPTVKNNTMGEGNTPCNVYLDVDSNAVIQSNGIKANSWIGVYASDAQLEAHGVEGMPFGTYGNISNLHCFINDRTPYLYGVMSADTTDKKIYWSKNICKITDGSGNLLYRDPAGAACRRPAVFTMLYSTTASLKNQCAFNALDTETFYDADGTEATPAYVKMLVDKYSSPVALTVQVPAKNDITLTTASKTDTDYPGPYEAGKPDSVCVLKKGNITGSFFRTQQSARDAGTTFTLENITLDGDSQLNTTSNTPGGLIYARGKVVLGNGTTLQNSISINSNGGAVSIGSKVGTVIDSSVNDSLTVHENAVIRNCHGKYGGAIYLQDGALTLKGRIENCSTDNTGGGVQVNKGKFYLEGGSITSCSAKRGGGAYVNQNSCYMTMRGGKITGCTATDKGGGIGINGANSNGARLYFEGDAQVYGNTRGGDPCDVDLDTYELNQINDVTSVINVTEAGLGRNARIGVYVPDRNNLYNNYGVLLKPFGKYENAAYLENFFNDRNDYSGGINPRAADAATTIYWMDVFSLEVINDVVSDLASDAEIPFTFTVMLADADGVPITGEHGLMDFEDGSCTFTLKKGESLLANDLPVGATYTVTMTEDERFTTNPESLKVTGTIGEEVNGAAVLRTKVTFTNTRKVGRLTIHKKVVEPRPVENEAFAFTVTLGDRTISKAYAAVDQDGANLPDVVFTRGVAQVSLKAEESIAITGLPMQAGYTVVEDMTGEQQDYYTAYPNQKQQGTIDVDSEVTFSNRKTVYVCKITTSAGLMTDSRTGKSAVYGRLEDAFDAINSGKLRTSNNKTTSIYTIEMIVPEYEMEGTATLSASGRTVTLTTAQQGSGLFDYPQDAVGPAKVTRGFDGGSMISVTKGTLKLTDIVLDGDAENHQSTANGGIVYAGSTLYIQEGAVLQNSKTTANGSAVFLANNKKMYMSGGSITGNEVAGVEGGAIGVGGKSAKIFFSGNAQVTDNAMTTSDGRVDANVCLNQNSNAVINAQGLGEDASIGVYVTGAQTAAPFTKRGGNLCDFGAYTNAARLDHFVNDRTGLTGMARTTDGKIVWLKLVSLTVSKALSDPYSDAEDRPFTLSATFSGGSKGCSYLWSDGTTSRTVTEGASGAQTAIFTKSGDGTTTEDESTSATFYLPAQTSATLTETSTGRAAEYYLTRMAVDNADAIFFTTQMTGTRHSATFKLDGDAVTATVTNTRVICKLTDGSGNLLYEDAQRTIPAAYSVLDSSIVGKINGTLYKSNGAKYSNTGAVCLKMLVPEYGVSQPLQLTGLDRTVTLTTAGASDADFPYSGSDNATLTRSFTTVGSLIVSDSTLTITNLELDGNNQYDPTNETEADEETGAQESHQYGGIVSVQGGTLTLAENALLTKGSARAGGAIYIANSAATVALTGGTIENSAAANGGAIYAASGTLAVSGGEISDNSATGASAYGGAIFLAGGAQATVSGGTISDNSAGTGGGAVYAESTAKLAVSGGTISGNQATNTSGGSHGGAIFLTGGAQATLSGGTISDNSAVTGGGAVYAESTAALTVSGSASIAGNQATGESACGGAIFATAQSSVTMSGGTISGTLANSSAVNASYGGAVYLESKAAFSMTGGTIQNSKATSGGAIYTASTGSVSVSGGTITGNSATGANAYGGGIAVANGCALSLSGSARITGNEAAQGGGAYVDGGTLNLSGSANITGNTAGAVADGGGVFINAGGAVHVKDSVVINNNTAASSASNLSLYGDESLVVDGDLTTSAAIGICTEKTEDIDQIGVENGVKDNLDRIKYDRDNSIYAIAFGTKKVVWNFAPVCKLTDANGALLFADATNEEPAVYPTLPQGFAAAAGALSKKNGDAYAATEPIQVKLLVDVKLGAEIGFAANRSLTLTTAETAVSDAMRENADTFVYVPGEDSDATGTRATVKRDFETRGSMFAITGKNTTFKVESIVLDGALKHDPTGETEDTPSNIGRVNEESHRGAYQRGGIIRMEKGTLNVNDGALLKKGKANKGGAIYGYSGSIIVLNAGAKISECQATLNGGGVYTEIVASPNGSYHNSNHDTSYGLLHLNGTADKKVVIENCQAGDSGGAIYETETYLVASYAEFKNNQATNRGGAICIDTVPLYTWGKVDAVLENISVTDNTAKNGGGICADRKSNLTIKGTSVISDNTASQKGGGIYANNLLNIEGVEVSSNQAINGGGLYTGGSVSLKNSVKIKNNTTNAKRTDGTEDINGAGGFYMSGGTLTFAGDADESNPTTIDGNTTENGKSSNLRLPPKGNTKDNSLTSVNLKAEFKGKIRVVNPGTVYSFFGNADNTSYLANYKAQPDQWETLPNITSEDGSRLFGVAISGNEDGSEAILQWWQLPICKITDGNGTLLYLDQEGTKQAVYMSLYDGTVNSAFGTLNDINVKLYRNGEEYTGSDFCVKLLDDCPINQAIKVNPNGNSRKNITLTTAGKNDTDDLPFRGSGDTAKVYIGPLYHNGNYDFLFQLERDTVFTAKKVVVDGGAKFALDDNNHLRFGDNGKPICGSGYFISKKDGFLFLMAGNSTLILDDGATLQNAYTFHQYGGGAISFGNNGGSDRTVVLKSGSRIQYCCAKIQESSDHGDAANIGKGGYGGAITFYQASNGDTVRMEGGTISDCWAERTGGAIHVRNQNNTLAITGGTIQNCTAAQGGGIYLAADAKIKLQGNLTFSDNYGTDYASFANLKNGGEAAYAGGKVRQDIFVSQFKNTPTDAITITGNFDDGAGNATAAGSIWVWVEPTAGTKTYHRDGDQFAVLDPSYTPPTDEEAYASMLKVFRNARADGKVVESDATTKAFTNNVVDDGSGIYLTGRTGADISGKKCVYWGQAIDGYNIVFRKIDGNGNALTNAVFTLCEANEDGTIKKDASGKPVPVQASGEAVTATSGKGTKSNASAGTNAENPVSVQVQSGTGDTATVTGKDVYGDGLVVFDKVSKGVYYLVETQVNDASGNASADYAANLIYKLDVNEKGLYTLYAESKDSSGNSVWTTEAPKKTLSFGTGADAYDVDLYTALNESAKTRKVILKKVDGDNAPLAGACFKVYRADMTEVVIDGDYTQASGGMGYYESKATGVYFIATLPYGTYYLLETKAPTGAAANAGKVFVLTVSATGATVPTAADTTLSVTGNSESAIVTAFLTKMGVPPTA